MELIPDDIPIRVETSLNVSWEDVELLCGLVDDWIIDIKDMNKEIYECLQRKIEVIKHSEKELQIDWIKAYYKAPTPLSTGRFLELPPELQVLVLDKMFSTQLWDAIIRLYDSKPNTEEPVKLQLAFHAGLSCFNVQAYERAAELLDALAGQKVGKARGSKYVLKA